jgi:hypothetical protein
MRIIQFSLATVLCLLVLSCSENTESSLPVYDLVEVSGPETVSLSTVCDDIEYIPLETGEEVMGHVQGIRYAGGRYAIQSGSSISVFDSDSKLIHVLDKQGRGPDEYTSAFVYDINGAGELIINDTGKDRFLMYSPSNDLIREIKNMEGTWGLRFFGDNRLFLTGPNHNGTNKVSLAVINLMGDTLISIPNKFLFEPSVMLLFRFECVTYTREEKLFYHEVMDDTIYWVNDDMERSPYAVLNTGEMRFTPEKRSNVSLSGPPEGIFVSDIIETEDYFFVECSGKEHLIVKDTGETIVLEDGVLQNDLDGGMPFYPDLLVDDRYLVQVVDAFEFNLWLQSDHFKNFSDDPEKKEEFRALAEKLTENDNPVLVRCRLK